jgi:hypothetical protein
MTPMQTKKVIIIILKLRPTRIRETVMKNGNFCAVGSSAFTEYEKAYLHTHVTGGGLYLDTTMAGHDHLTKDGATVFFRVDATRPIKIKGVHNYWGTGNRDREFTAKPKYTALTFRKAVDKDGNVSFNCHVTTRGELHYKYQRHYNTDPYAEIYNNFLYNDNLHELIVEALEVLGTRHNVLN